MDMVAAVVVALVMLAVILVISLHLLDKVETVVADMVAEHIHAQDMDHHNDLVQKLETTWDAQAGYASMGGGGGGASAYPSTPGMTGKSGGSGVVMFRYLYPHVNT